MTTRTNPWAKRCSALVLGFGALLVSAGPALALPGDREQPVHIESDQAEHSQREGKTVYAGAVRLTQGSLLITAEQITIHTDENNEVERILAEGNPAHFEQQPDKNEPLIIAEGNRIRYRASDGTVRLSGNAKLTQKGSTMTGDRIDYDLDSETVQAQGNPESDSPRIEMVIPPRNEENRD